MIEWSYTCTSHRYAFTAWKRAALPLSWLDFWQGQEIFHSYATTTVVEPVGFSLLINRVVRLLFIS
jgi:hypothetical protein